MTTSPLSDWLKRYPLSTFYGLAFVISWLGWNPHAAYSSGKLSSTSFLESPSQCPWLISRKPSLGIGVNFCGLAMMFAVSIVRSRGLE